MRTSEDGINVIKKFEGCKLTPYKDVKGLWTIGVGHLMSEYQDIVLTQNEADELLEHDLNRTEKAINRLIKVPLKQYQFDALVSFTFNLGAGALQRSTLRAKINREDYDEAADEFLKWCRAGPNIIKGLVLRRQAERKMFLGFGL